MKATLSKKNRSKPLVVNIKGDWELAMAAAISRPKPEGGWPDPQALDEPTPPRLRKATAKSKAEAKAAKK